MWQLLDVHLKWFCCCCCCCNYIGDDFHSFCYMELICVCVYLSLYVSYDSWPFNVVSSKTLQPNHKFHYIFIFRNTFIFNILWINRLSRLGKLISFLSHNNIAYSVNFTISVRRSTFYLTIVLYFLKIYSCRVLFIVFFLLFFTMFRFATSFRSVFLFHLYKKNVIIFWEVHRIYLIHFI